MPTSPLQDAEQLPAPKVPMLVIANAKGENILTIGSDGITVSGSIENASEAAEIFVRELRRMFSGEPLVYGVAQ